MDKAYAPCAPLVEGALGAPERAVAAPVAGRPAVVRCDDDDGVLVLARLFERGHHLRELSASCILYTNILKICWSRLAPGPWSWIRIQGKICK